VNKFYFLVTLILIISCTNNKGKDVAITSIVTNKIASIKDTLPKGEVDFSEINWNYYLKMEEFEQNNSDSALLVIVKPKYAIFVYTQEDDSSNIVAYDITRFKKQNNEWIKLQNQQINDLSGFIDNTDKWRFEDINGDNIKDILLEVNKDGRKNKNYLCYLQDKFQQEFIQVENFEKIDNPQYDTIKKVLSTKSYAHREIDEEIYVWEDNKLKFVKGKSIFLGYGKNGGNIEEEYYTKN
jgi:hypothetical protein